MVATGASGTTTVRYGAMRENVLSLVVVTADGQVVRTRSRARKSSAGYDLTRLFVGSEGTLGARLRGHAARAAHARGDVGRRVRLPDPARRGRLRARRVASTRSRSRASSCSTRCSSRPSTATTSSTTRSRRRSSSSSTARRTRSPRRPRRPSRSPREHGGTGFAWATDEAQRRRMWDARHRAYDATRALRPGTSALTTDVGVPVSALADTILRTRADLDEHGLTGSILGHVGDGNFHVDAAHRPRRPGRRRARHGVPRPRGARRARGRRHVHRRARRRLRQGELPRARARRRGRAMMRAIKRALDPDDIFNPGKIVDAAILARRVAGGALRSDRGACRSRPRRLADRRAHRSHRARARRLGAAHRRAPRRARPAAA